MIIKDKKRTILHESIFNSKFEIGINYQDKGVVIDNHYHDYIELVCQINGESLHYIDNKPLKLEANHILLINKSQMHKNEACTDDVLNIVIPEEFLNTMLVESSYDRTIILFKSFISNHKKIDTYSLNSESVSILQSLSNLYQNHDHEVMYHFRIKLYVIQFLISLNYLYANHIEFDDTTIDLITYINNNLSNASLNEYARLINYSPSSASQKIKYEYNTSFIDILQTARLKHATTKLLSSNCNIESIMEEVGYSNKTYFYNIFKGQYGLTPNQYRKKFKD